ncbi:MULTISPECIES: hypothetical protein [Halomonadaceae]|nr:MULTISPECIES: hypothetical protein [Halomonas]|tara:strand:+ start:7256 stop:7477 length:222 start_codon:yes stop_codon:yes gene_type:complete
MVSTLCDFVARTRQDQKSALVESAVPEFAVEAFDERILRRFARLVDGRRHLSQASSKYRLAGQLRLVIADNRS